MKINTLKAREQKELTEVLTSFGLKEKEQAVYLTLLSSGPTTTTPLARLVGFPTTTAEAILNRLYRDGIIAISKRKSRHVYEALEPAALKHVLEKKIEEVTKIIPFLQELRKETASTAKVHVYYRERVADIFLDALRTKNKLIYEIVAAKELQDVIGEKLHFTKRRVARGVKLKSLRVESHEIKKYSRLSHERELREAKFLPREITFAISCMMWDTTVVFMTPKSEGVAVVIESRALAEAVRQIFDLLWSISRTMETA